MRTPFARQLASFGSGPRARDTSPSGLRASTNLWAPGGERLRTRPGTRIIAAGPAHHLPAGKTLVVDGATADTDRVIAASGNDIYVGSEDPFDGFSTGQVAQTATLTDHFRLQVEYWNGTEWVEVVGLVDGTERFEDGYTCPLAVEGEVHFRRPEDWATRAVAGYGLLAFVFWVRFRTVRIRDDAAMWPFSAWSNNRPGFRVFTRRPVNGLEVSNIKRSHQILVGGDARPRPYMGGGMPAILRGRTSRVLNPTWRFGTAIVRDGNEVPVGGAAPTVPTTTTVGTADQITDTANRADMPPNGYLQRSPWGAALVTDIAPSAAGSNAGYNAARFDTLNPFLAAFVTGDLEGFMLETTTAGGFGSVGDRYEILKTTVAGGSMQLLIGPTAGAPSLTTRFSLVAPPSVYQLGEDPREYEVGGPAVAQDAFPISSYSFHAAPIKDIAPLQVRSQSRYAMLGGAQYVSAIDPVDGRLILTNGSAMYVYDGQHFRPYTVEPLDSPLVQQFYALLPVESAEHNADPAAGSRAPAFRGAPPAANLLTTFGGRFVTARDNLLAWSAPVQYRNVWPLSNLYRCLDGSGGRITSLIVRDSTLLVSTRAATFEMQFNDRGSPSVRRGNTEGFLSQRATKLIVLEGATGVIGPTEKGVQVYTGGEPIRILERWADIVPEGVDASDLELAPAVFAPSTNTYLIAVRAAGQTTRSTIVVLDIANKAWWRWTVPFGVETMALDAAGANADQVLLGCSDGLIRAFTQDDFDDEAPVEWSFVTQPIAFTKDKTRAALNTFRVVARNSSPPNAMSLKLWIEDKNEVWLDDALTWYNPEATFVVNDGFSYTRFAGNGLLSIETRLPTGTTGTSAVVQLSGRGDLDLQSVLLRGVER